MTPKEEGVALARELGRWAIQQSYLRGAVVDWRPVHIQLGRETTMVFKPLGERVVYLGRVPTLIPA